jgi:hypothetical protein
MGSKRRNTCATSIVKVQGPPLLLQCAVLELYGPRLNMGQVAELLGLSHGTVFNKISAGTLGLKTYVDFGKRFADYRDVASYLDEIRAAARECEESLRGRPEKPPSSAGSAKASEGRRTGHASARCPAPSPGTAAPMPGSA